MSAAGGFLHQVEPYITNAERNAVSEYLSAGGWLTEFGKTQEFERMLAEIVGARFSVVVTSGTVALYLALLACGVGPGDRVAVPNYTMIATPNAVLWAGARPVLVDVDPGTHCLDLQSLRLGGPLKALMYVSIGGRSGNMTEVVEYCEQRGITLIEDSCQALCSRWNGKALGTFGALGAYSFTPHKIITTGQGGALVTDNEDLYRRAAKLKDFSRVAVGQDWHDGLGFNFKFTDLQSVLGIEQLKTIDFRISSRRSLFRWYSEALSGVKGVQMLETDLEQTTPWFVEILLQDRKTRDGLLAHLKEQGIGSRPFYPPINHQPMFESEFPRGSFPVSESLAHRGLWLPSSIGLEREKVLRVCDEIKRYLGSAG